MSNEISKERKAVLEISGEDQMLFADGLDEEDAWEFLEFNTFDAYMGEMTPMFIERRWK